MLVTAAPLLLLFGLSRPWRIAAAVVLVGVGLLLSEPLFMFLYFWTQSRGPIGVWLSSPEVLLVVAGLTCFAGGSFLAFRAIFDRTT